MLGHILQSILSPNWSRTFRDHHPFWAEYLGETFSGISVAALVTLYVERRIKWIEKKSLYVGANWSWDVIGAKGQDYVVLHPNVSVISRTKAPKLIIHSVWVRESKPSKKPSKTPAPIYGHFDLTKAGMTHEKRTTGGDPLYIEGPRIDCEKVEMLRVMRYPIWIQTSDNQWFKAQSMGNLKPHIWQRLWPFQRNKPELKQ